MAAMINSMPDLECNGRRRDAHLTEICASIATAQTGLAAAAEAGVEGELTLTNNEEEPAGGLDGSSAASFTAGVATSFAAVVAMMM